MNGSSQPPGEGQKPPLSGEAGSNGGSLVAKKRKKDVKPIITTDGQLPRHDEAKLGYACLFFFVSFRNPLIDT